MKLISSWSNSKSAWIPLANSNRRWCTKKKLAIMRVFLDLYRFGAFQLDKLTNSMKALASSLESSSPWSHLGQSIKPSVSQWPEFSDLIPCLNSLFFWKASFKLPDPKHIKKGFSQQRCSAQCSSTKYFIDAIETPLRLHMWIFNRQDMSQINPRLNSIRARLWLRKRLLHNFLLPNLYVFSITETDVQSYNQHQSTKTSWYWWMMNLQQRDWRRF